MNLIELATQRLEQLHSAGIAVPWSVAELSEGPGKAPERSSSPAAAHSGFAPTIPVDPGPARVAHLRAPVRPPPAEPRHWARIDLDRLGELGYIIPERDRSELAEQFKHLKRGLFKSIRSKEQPVQSRGTAIMVSSALPGEGKTFCSINLAISMAMEIDTSVILIDADVVRPSLLARLGIEHEGAGLLDLLSQEDAELPDALLATNVPKLTIMSSGQPRRRSTEWLASDSMTMLLERLAREYPDHVVIFDAPPLLLTSESAVLAGKVGQVVMVVEAGKTRSSAVREAFDMVKHCPTVLPVLNKGEQGSESRRYGYYYG